MSEKYYKLIKTFRKYRERANISSLDEIILEMLRIGSHYPDMLTGNKKGMIYKERLALALYQIGMRAYAKKLKEYPRIVEPNSGL